MSCFFVGGINRSGTTLLQSILCSDDTTNPLIHEASYLRSIVDAYDSGRRKFEEHNKYYFDSVGELREFTARWAGEFIGLVRRRYPQARHVVLKHPPLTPRFPLIHELLSGTGEDVRFFIIVRDPRDVIASLVRIGERLRAQGDPEGATLPRDMSRLGNYYQMTYMPALGHPDAEYRRRVTMVRYEDLVTDPAPVIETLRRASGLALAGFDALADWHDSRIDLEGLKKTGNAWLSELWGKGISAANIGSYRATLTAEEIATVEKVCAGPLRTFGYNQ